MMQRKKGDETRGRDPRGKIGTDGMTGTMENGMRLAVPTTRQKTRKRACRNRHRRSNIKEGSFRRTRHVANLKMGKQKGPEPSKLMGGTRGPWGGNGGGIHGNRPPIAWEMMENVPLKATRRGLS